MKKKRRTGSIDFHGIVNMLDADKIAHLSEGAVYGLSDREWLESAWNLSVDGIAKGRTRVVDTQDGIWRIWCDSMMTIASMIPHGEIISRIHQLHDLRRLPILRGLDPLPPVEIGTPMAMLRSIPWQKMPENLWISFAWRMAVDPETAETTRVSGIQNGVWQIRCDSSHAWEFLQYPVPVVGMLRWFGQMRALPPVRRLVPLLGNFETKIAGDEKKIEICADESDIPASIADPEIRRILSHLRPGKPK